MRRETGERVRKTGAGNCVCESETRLTVLANAPIDSG